MSDSLDPQNFTTVLLERLASLPVQVNSPETLSLQILYGQDEPALTLNLKAAFDDYEQDVKKLDDIANTLKKEVAWTLQGTRYAFSDIAENSLPLMRDLLKNPFAPGEAADGSEALKGPLLYQDLVVRQDEHIIVQYVMAKNELIQPLHTGDMLRSYPDPSAFGSNCIHNLRLRVLKLGITISEYEVENSAARPWLVGLRGGSHRDFLASLITVPEVMKTLEQSLKAENGLVAIVPARDQLLVSANGQDVPLHMGLLARFLKEKSEQPLSAFMWHFKDGGIERVQALDLAEQSEERSEI